MKIIVNKTQEKLINISQEVNVINRDIIETFNPTNSADLLSKQGLQVQMSQQGGGSPTLRGFEASRILLVIDGVRMNNLIYRAGHLQDIIKTDVNLLDRVEILYGPSSTIYGSDALGGVIHLRTKKPMFSSSTKKDTHVSFLSKYSSANNGITNHVDFNFGSNKFALLTSVSFNQFGDLQGGKNRNPFYDSNYGERPYYIATNNGIDSIIKNDNRFLQVGTAYNQVDFIQKVSFKQDIYTTHDFNFQYSTTNNVLRYDRLTDVNSTGSLKFAEWYYGPQTRLMAAYTLNNYNNNRFMQNFHLNISYQSLQESRHNRSYKSEILNNRIENVNVIGYDIYAQHESEKSKLLLGFDGQLNSLKSTANAFNIINGIRSPLDTRYPDGDNLMNNFGLYVSHSYKLSRKTNISEGARLGYSALRSTLVDTALLFNLPYTSIEQTTPVYSVSFGIIHRPSISNKLSFTIATGFRVPNVDDLSKIFGSSEGNVIVPNKELKPEQTINYEIGYTQFFGSKTSLENYVYYTSIKDIAVVDKFTFNGQDSIVYDGSLSQVLANQNKNKGFIYGASSNITTDLNDYFNLQCGFNYTYGRLKTDSVDSPLDHIPPFIARLALSYKKDKVKALFYSNYNAAKKLKDYFLNGEDNEQYATPDGMPAWITLNISASYKIQRNIDFNFIVENILDTQYRVFASGMNAAGRNFILSLRGNF
ncbi:MAG: TonB-dependent receptor plug domain-containing protein [Bacteroidota bacterium]